MTIQSTGKSLDYKDFVKYSQLFCETGNASGDGIQRALDAGFIIVYGCEASEYWFNSCVTRFENKSVYLKNEKSIEFLSYFSERMAKDIIVFYLDAHVSGDTSAGYEDWIEKGEESDFAQDKTIKAELRIILAHSKKHVIIIDDVNGVADGHAHEYAAIMQEANPGYKFYFYDECLSGDPEFYYKDKLLCAIP